MSDMEDIEIPISAVSVDAAAVRMSGRIHRTPLLESIALNNLLNARVLVKAECTQKAGSFKIRGAMNRVLSLSPEEREKVPECCTMCCNMICDLFTGSSGIQ